MSLQGKRIAFENRKKSDEKKKEREEIYFFFSFECFNTLYAL
jgi:hypothetical protein